LKVTSQIIASEAPARASISISVQFAGDIAVARADHALGAVDDHLWRIDARRAPARRIGALAVGILLVAEGVGPADIIPVVDMPGEGDDIGPLGELGQHGVGLGTGRAALRGDQLHHRLGVGADLAGMGRREQQCGRNGGGQEEMRSHADVLGKRRVPRESI
jgi:hypothetical protein